MYQKRMLFYISPTMIWIMLAIILIPTYKSLMYNCTTLIEWNILSMLSSPVMFTLIMDPVGLTFSCTVLLISANVLKFSSIYMKEDKFIDRFTMLVLLFILSMNMLIFLPHLMILLIGWDGLGIVSFILVIYYNNAKSLSAGMITAMTNRIGDVMLLTAIAMTMNQGHWNIMIMYPISLETIQILCILIAAMTKSAQMPFSSWLPAAMAAPTPVSALVHSSTLVTAGVFLMIRFSPLLKSVKWSSSCMLIVAVSTTVMAGISAMTECDMKKIIALSTLSQLGMMMAAIGLGMTHLAFFHMITHALFKAMLFICAGNMIHTHNHSQDLRWMGNVNKTLPITSSCLIVANLALCGFPFMSGFYSKDLIIEVSMFMPNSILAISMMILGAGLTSSYSTRFLMCTILGPNNSAPLISMKETFSMTNPIMILAIMSTITGSALLWNFPMKQEVLILSLTHKTMILTMTILGLITGFIISYSKMNSFSMKMPMFLNFSSTMWFLVPLSSQLMLKWPLNASHQFLKLSDQSWLECWGGGGAMKSLYVTSNNIMSSIEPNPMSLIMSSMMLMFTTMIVIL